MPRKSIRNREIFNLCQAGQSRDEVALRFGLTASRIMAILREERLKRDYSLDEAYRSLRRQPVPSGKA